MCILKNLISFWNFTVVITVQNVTIITITKFVYCSYNYMCICHCIYNNVYIVVLLFVYIIIIAVIYFVLTTCIVCIYYHTELLELFNVPVVITVICETLTKSLRSSHPRPPAPITRILHVSWINFKLWKKKKSL